MDVRCQSKISAAIIVGWGFLVERNVRIEFWIRA